MKEKKYCQVCFEEEATVGNLCHDCYDASVLCENVPIENILNEDEIFNKLAEIEKEFTVNEYIHEYIEEDIEEQEDINSDLVRAKCISIESRIEEVLKDTNHTVISTEGYRSCGYDEFSVVAIWVDTNNKIQTYEFQIEYC